MENRYKLEMTDQMIDEIASICHDVFPDFVKARAAIEKIHGPDKDPMREFFLGAFTWGVEWALGQVAEGSIKGYAIPKEILKVT